MMTKQYEFTDWSDFMRRPDFLELNDAMLEVMAQETGDVESSPATEAYEELGKGMRAYPPSPSRYVSATGEMVRDIDDGEDEVDDPLGDSLAVRGMEDEYELDDDCWPMFGYAELQNIAKQIAITHRVGSSEVRIKTTAYALAISDNASSLLEEAYYHFVAHDCRKSNLIMRSFLDSFMSDLVEFSDDEDDE